MKQFNNLTIFLLLIAFISLLFAHTSAYAEGISLGISPPILQITAVPPASIKAPITVENLGEETVTLRIVFRSFKQADTQDGQVRYLSKEERAHGANPLLFQKIQIRDNTHVITSVTLAPRQAKQLDVHIGILKDEPLSDYYFSILFVSNEGEDLQINGPQSVGGVGIPVLLSIGPKGSAKAVIEEFSVPSVLTHGPVPFTVRIRNSGEHVIAPQGNIVIKNMFGQTVGNVMLLPVNILAGTVRTFPDSLQNIQASQEAEFTFVTETYKGKKAVWLERFLLGAYTATLTVAVTDQGPLYKQTIQFVGAPVQVVIGIILGLWIVVYISIRIKKKIS